MYHNFVGIDISKNDFVVAIHGSKKTFKYLNNCKGFNDLLEKHPILKDNSLVVLETTGGYEKAWKSETSKPSSVALNINSIVLP